MWRVTGVAGTWGGGSGWRPRGWCASESTRTTPPCAAPEYVHTHNTHAHAHAVTGFQVHLHGPAMDVAALKGDGGASLCGARGPHTDE